MAIEDSSEHASKLMVKLIKYLYSANVVTPTQMANVRWFSVIVSNIVPVP